MKPKIAFWVLTKFNRVDDVAVTANCARDIVNPKRDHFVESSFPEIAFETIAAIAVASLSRPMWVDSAPEASDFARIAPV